MIIPSGLIQKYTSHQQTINVIADKARDTLSNYCNLKGYAFMSRIKTLESLAEKIETGRFQKWSELDDLFACTIIIPTLTQENEAIDFCASTFNLIRTVKRGQTLKAPDVFRFDAPRVYVRLRKTNGLESTTIPPIHDITFEIQIRTAFEHAWSVTMHSLAYKAPDINWKRLRLAAQVKATVEQLDTLILAFEQTIPYISENPWPELKVKQEIFARIKRIIEDGHIPSEYVPNDLSRYCNNLYTLLDKTRLEKTEKSALRALTEKSALRALTAIELEVAKTSKEMFPKSISFFQYTLAILVKQGIIILPIPDTNYSCHISKELLELYPNLHQIEHNFDYEG